MKNHEIPADWGVFAVVSRDCQTVGIGMGAEVYAVARLAKPIPPREWHRFVSEAWANPEDGAIQRAIDAAAVEYGPATTFDPVPLDAEFQPLGHETSE